MEQEVMNESLVLKRIERMALEILERVPQNSILVVMGIQSQGAVIADLITNILKKETTINVENNYIQINKLNPKEVNIKNEIQLKNKTVVLVDDVTNSGKTMMYALVPILALEPQKIITASLIARTYKNFPIQVDVVGKNITTLPNQHIDVLVNGNQIEKVILKG